LNLTNVAVATTTTKSEKASRETGACRAPTWSVLASALHVSAMALFQLINYDMEGPGLNGYVSLKTSAGTFIGA